MKKLLIMTLSLFLLTSCSTGEQPIAQTLGSVPSCDQIDISKASDKNIREGLSIILTCYSTNKLIN